MFQDLKYGVRLLTQSKGWTAVAVLSLALGIGANTALFSVIDSVLLRKLPVRNPAELVLLDWVSGQRTMGQYSGFSTRGEDGSVISPSFSTLAFERFRAQTRTLSDVFAFRGRQLTLSAEGQADLVSGQFISGNYYSALGVLPFLGRLISDSDDATGADPAAVISHSYWRQRFNGDPSIGGKVVWLNNVPFTIVGITPPEFQGVSPDDVPDVSVAIATERRLNAVDAGQPTPLDEPWRWWVMIMGRLRPDSTPDQVRSELEGTLQMTAREGWDLRVSSMSPEARARTNMQRDLPVLRVWPGAQGYRYARGDYLRQVRILTAIAGFGLLIVCANVANLLMARAATREKEIAIRMAMGARRFRLFRQLLTESLLLAVCGGVLGSVFALWGADLFFAWMTGRAPEATEFHFEFRVFGFAAALSLLTGIVFGLLPGLRATKMDLTPAMKSAGSTSVKSATFMSRSLLVVQVAISMVLLVGAGLFIRTLQNLYGADVGFNRENLLLLEVDAERANYPASQLAGLYKGIMQGVTTVPGVRSVTMTEEAPLSNSGSGDIFSMPGRTPTEADQVSKMRVPGNFFDVMGIPLLLGRSFTNRDIQGAPRVAVVSESVARQYFRDSNPIGQMFRLGGNRDGEQVEIVGVAKDANHRNVRGDAPRTVFLPFAQSPSAPATLVIRTTDQPKSLIQEIRKAIGGVDDRLPVYGIQTQSEQLDRLLRRERLFAVSSALFGVLALTIACIGLYGITSYSVARRTKDIGVRIALGARRSDVLRLVMRETLSLVSLGIVIGLAGSIAATRFIASMLYGLTPDDPSTFAAAAIMMLVVAGVAAYLPAHRASRVDPLITLHNE